MPFCTKCGKELEPDAAFCPRCGTPAGTTLSGVDSVIKEPAAQHYWVDRLIAFVIDAVIVYLALGILAFVFALPFFFTGGIGSIAAAVAGVFSFLAGIVLVFYFSLFEASSGSSLGKMAMGLAVRSKTGSNPTFIEALVRNLSKIYWVLLLLDVIVGLATSKGYTQKLSDRFAGTSVSKR